MVSGHCALSDRDAPRAIEGVSIAVGSLPLFDFLGMYHEISMSKSPIFWRGYSYSFALWEWLELLLSR